MVELDSKPYQILIHGVNMKNGWIELYNYFKS